MKSYAYQHAPSTHYIPRGAWQRRRTLPDGHRIFIGDDSSHGLMWAIADDSGPTPPETDDGILLLDFGRPLSVTYDTNFKPRRPCCFIPLRDAGGQTRTITDAPSLLILATMFAWQIQHGDTFYKVEAQ
jgi:hypothetical protein